MLGFCSQWVSWINNCSSFASFLVLVNGIPGDRLFPSRGIRQGDLLSNYLFIMCVELLIREIYAASMAKEKRVEISI